MDGWILTVRSTAAACNKSQKFSFGTSLTCSEQENGPVKQKLRVRVYYVTIYLETTSVSYAWKLTVHRNFVHKSLIFVYKYINF